MQRHDSAMFTYSCAGAQWSNASCAASIACLCRCSQGSKEQDEVCSSGDFDTVVLTCRGESMHIQKAILCCKAAYLAIAAGSPHQFYNNLIMQAWASAYQENRTQATAAAMTLLVQVLSPPRNTAKPCGHTNLISCPRPMQDLPARPVSPLQPSVRFLRSPLPHTIHITLW